MRALAAIVAAAVLVLGGQIISASGAETSPRAVAKARAGSGSVGPLVEAIARNGRSAHHEDAVDMPSLKVRSAEANATTRFEGVQAFAEATAAARTVEILGGRVTAYGVRRTIRTDGGETIATGRVDGLRIDGNFIGDVIEERVYDLPDGQVIVNRNGVGLRVKIGEDVDIKIAVVDVLAVDGQAVPDPTPEATPKAEKDKKAKKARKAKTRNLKRKAAPDVEKRLTSRGYAFPVYGDRVDVADDWGGPRQIGPHQGNDLFAPMGTPVLAVADGTVRKVGTLPISGNRLWIITDGGDAFFYAHLSAFSPEAVTGRRVKAGTVLGFVGNTGDAEPTPPHLHFEIHPGGMEEDAVNPHPFLLAWRDRRDVPPGAWLQAHGDDAAERPGSLVEVRDFIAGE